MDPGPRRRQRRRPGPSALAGLGLGLALLAGCTGEVRLEADPATELSQGAVTQEPPLDGVVLAGSDPADLAVAASRTYFASAGVVVITPQDDAAQLSAASIGMALGLPVLVTGEEGMQDVVAAELERLETHTVLVTGEAEVPELSPDRPFLRAVTAPTDLDALQVVIGRDLAGEVPVDPGAGATAIAAAQEPYERLLTEVVPVSETDDDADPDASPSEEASTSSLADLPGLPPFLAPERLVGNALVSDGGPGQLAALGTARAAGASVVITDDVAADPAAIAALYGIAPRHVIGIGDLGDPETFRYRAAVAVTGVVLPGGGQSVVDDKVYVGLRGSPGAPELGSLGEQGVAATVERLQLLAAQTPSSAQVVPTAVVLATVASAEPGTDGSYSGKRSLDDLRPLVEAARDEGVSVLLTFQQGRQSLVEQVRLYDELLMLPNVGVAVEPAWRLAPGEVPGGRAGQVSAAEINEVGAHLDVLAVQQSLPPKLLVVRLSSTGGVSDPENLDVTRAPVHVVLEVDGSGVTAPAPSDPAAPAPTDTAPVLTAEQVWDGATSLPFDSGPGGGSWGWAQAVQPVAPAELLALTPPPLLITYP